MQCKKNVIWWLVNGGDSLLLKEEDKKIEALMPLVQALFPGINYYSVTGFSQVMHQCVVPALKKRFPDLQSVPEESTAEGEVEINELLPSKGYEWQDSPEWGAKLGELLAAA